MREDLRPRSASLQRPSPLHLGPEAALARLRQMLRIRRFEERAAEDYAAGRIRGFLHLYIGEEAVAVGVMEALEPSDAVVAAYRDHGHALARGLPMASLMAEMYGKASGCSRGRGGSMHFFDEARRFYGGHAIVGAGLPVAVGLALADRMLGRGGLSACFFGDGATDEGIFHESLNLAALWALPVLFVCENNLYAMGTALPRHQSETELHRKAASYRIAAEVVDGMDVAAVAEAAARAATAIRASGAPRFLELRTYRFRGHSMADPELYRDKEEVARWKARDPISAWRERILGAQLADREALERIEAEVTAEVLAAVAVAEAAPLEPVSDLERHVLTEGP